MATSFAPIPLHHAVTVRLKKTNYLIWRGQLLPHLRSNQLLGFLDGTISAPAKQIVSSSADGAQLVPNPEYVKWFNQDQQLLSGLLSSMSEEILPDVNDSGTSKEAWDKLQRMFGSATRARVVQIRVDLATAKKGDLSAGDYFSRIKGLASELAAANSPISDDEVIVYLLAGLGPDYDSFVTSMTTKDALTLDEVYAHLMTFEARLLKHHSDQQLRVASTAHFAGRGSPFRGRGRNRGRGRGSGRFPPSRGDVPSRSSGDRRTPSQRPTCQICGREGHTAIRCWHRMDEAYHEDPSAMVATSSYKIDPNWYSDTGATDHITSDLDRLAVREQYNGGDKVHVGDGTGLRILHTGHASLRTASRSLALRNILHVPAISKNLLSVHKLARDNDIFFEYHPWHFSIKDRQTGNSLLKGRCEAGLYPIKPSDVAALNQALLSKSTNCVQWHARLGHPSFQTVQSILRLNNISFTRESNLPVCSACQIAKSHQLPYATSIHQSTAPLQMIFSDVWGLAPHSVNGFKYYISFIDDFSKFCWVYLMHDRTEAPRIFHEFQLHVERLLDSKIKCVQSDWGGEYQKMHNTFFDLLALIIVFHVRMHISRTALLNANIDILLKLVLPSSLMLTCL
jgi:hypothetical protein